MSGVFVTGTGTDIGKTFLSCLLLQHNTGARGIKPVLSGHTGEDLAGSDAGRLLAAQGRAVDETGLEAVSPFRFAAPLSPEMAAAAEGRVLDFAALLAFCRREMTEPGPLLIEGVGGVMVPMTGRHTVLDWMQELGLPVLLVGGSYLGGISHALTSIACLRARGLEIACMVLNESELGVDLEDTRASIARHGEVDVTVLRRGAWRDYAPAIRLISSAAGFP